MYLTQTMNLFPSHDPEGVIHVLNLIGEPDTLCRLPLEVLYADYHIQHFSPDEVIRQSHAEREAAMKPAAVTLIDWDEQSPHVLSVLKDVAHRYAVPLLVLCGPNQAEQVTALVVGGESRGG